MAKSALIVGSLGQDGQLLDTFLTSQGYQVYGLSRKALKTPTHTNQKLPAQVDILNALQVRELVSLLVPTEVYYLAAYHHSSEQSPLNGLAIWERSRQIHFDGALHFLQAIADTSPQSRFFYAASSLLFGSGSSVTSDGEHSNPFLVNESVPFAPETPYGVSKLAGLMACHTFNKQQGIFASSGILFNHESELRAPQFISSKIIRSAVAIQQKRQDKLVVGNLEALVDWSSARDVVVAMWKILQTTEAQNFIVASGKSHSVRDFIQIAFSKLGLDWEHYVQEDPSVLKRKLRPLVGDSSKLKTITGWQPQISFSDMIQQMLIAEGGKLVGRS